MATNVTKATLVGSESTIGIADASDITDQQLFSFPGLDQTFQTSLGFKGKRVVFVGLLRVSGANVATARANMQSQISTIEAYQRVGTELNLFQGGDTSSAANMYAGDFDGVIVEAFRQTGKRTYHSTSQVMNQPYQLVVRRLS